MFFFASLTKNLNVLFKLITNKIVLQFSNINDGFNREADVE